MTATLGQLYRPSHDESARQRFVGALKGYANGALEQKLAARYDHDLRPAFERAQGHAPADRVEARPLFEADPLYQLWGSMVYASQGLMWETVGATCERIGPRFEARAAELTGKARGSLLLDPTLVIPKPIVDVEIHRQPGGYFASMRPGDLHAALIYFGTIELYRAAKGLSANAPVGEPSRRDASSIWAVARAPRPSLCRKRFPMPKCMASISRRRSFRSRTPGPKSAAWRCIFGRPMRSAPDIPTGISIS